MFVLFQVFHFHYVWVDKVKFCIIFYGSSKFALGSQKREDYRIRFLLREDFLRVIWPRSRYQYLTNLIVKRDSLFTLSQVIIQDTALTRAIVEHTETKNDPQVAGHDQTSPDNDECTQQVSYIMVATKLCTIITLTVLMLFYNTSFILRPHWRHAFHY